MLRPQSGVRVDEENGGHFYLSIVLQIEEKYQETKFI